jgi:hypothetical protein
MDVWNIKNNFSEDNNIKIDNILINLCKYQEKGATFLLNKNKNSIIEILIKNIVDYHLKRLNIENEIFVEFFFKKYINSDINSFHIDCDEYDRCINKSLNYNTPFLSCITYLNDNNTNPTVITELDKEKYESKLFDNDSKLYISLPKKMKHIAFEGGKYYHGESKLILEESIRNILVINLWNIKPLNVPMFDFEYFIYKYSMNENKKIELFDVKDNIFTLHSASNKLVIKIDLLNSKIFENLLYKDKSNLFIIKDTIDKYNDYDSIVLKHEPMDELLLIDTSLEKFKQRFIIKKHFTKDICDWIIQESEDYALNHDGWTSNRHINYPTTDLPAELITSVFSFLFISFKNTICSEIIKKYELSEHYTFEISDAFIVKYDVNNQKMLEMHNDEASITSNILLSNTSEFTGGGTYFEEDDITIKLEQGDMILHSGNARHSGLEITQGKRYVLVFFINIKNIESNI